jgi:hypothetical protein
VNDVTILCCIPGLAKRNAEYGQGTGPIWLVDVLCSDTETAIHRCPHTGFSDSASRLDVGIAWCRSPCSSHEEDAGVFCYSSGKDTDVQ